MDRDDINYIVVKVDADGQLREVSNGLIDDIEDARVLERAGLARETMACIPADFIDDSVLTAIDRRIEAYHND